MSTSEKTCRLCMNTDAVIHLFTVDGDTTLVTNIRDCIDLKINIGDGLSDVICKICESHIKNFYEFKQMCLLVDSKLRAELLKKCLYSPNKLNLNDNDIILSENKINIKLECDDIFSNTPLFSVGVNKIDFKKEYDSWLSDETDSECYVEYLSNKVPLKREENQFQPEQLPNLAPPKHHKNKVNKKTPRNSRKSDFIPKKIYQCEICGRTLNNKSVLTKHIATHSGIKEFSCKLCSKTFTRAEHKVIHMRTHLGIKPCTCDKCGKSFTKRQDMIRHMRIHSDVKNYACPRCDRRFKRSGDVHSHMRTHTGARPYRCHLCEKSYTSHSGLQKHTKTHCKKEKRETTK